ncbi:MAG: aminotransferase class I/II-fold pyridoxal phosphate-dependent enzyme [Bacteroidales bacterium]|nr:aminotransferase class I/II-fold pyridoxal phosphate-dependent enzyme [Bacteroidales bacterium]
MIIQPADRTSSVQEYYFSRKLKQIAVVNEERRAAGLSPVINLGIGAPDGMPPSEAILTLVETAQLPGNHAYQSYVGLPELRGAFADWYSRYYGVTLNPANEIQPLVGSKEGILLTSLAFINKGDKVLVPDPGYPTYTSASRMVEAEILTYELKEENGWWPDFDALESMDLSGVKIMWVNYPHMPTGAKASRELYGKIVDFALRHRILVVNDNPYSFILNDDPISILSVDRAKECCLELNSLSKAHNMSGWRIGMIAGDKELISEVLKVKSQMDSGMFKPLQLAAVKALSQGPQWFSKLNSSYKERRVLAGEIFDVIGASYDHSSSGLFLWGRVTPDNLFAKAEEENGRSLGERVSDAIFRMCGVFITPGFIFGKNGEDYIRISLCAKPEVLAGAKELVKNAITAKL